MTTQIEVQKPMTSPENRTPYIRARKLMSGEIGNEFGNIICNCEIDDNPTLINIGNADYLVRVLNGFPKLETENHRLKAALRRLALAWSEQPLKISQDHGERLAAMREADALLNGK